MVCTDLLLYYKVLVNNVRQLVSLLWGLFLGRVYSALFLLLCLKTSYWRCWYEHLVTLPSVHRHACFIFSFFLLQMALLNACSWVWLVFSHRYMKVKACIGWHLLYWDLHNYIYLPLSDWLGRAWETGRLFLTTRQLSIFGHNRMEKLQDELVKGTGSWMLATWCCEKPSRP